MQGQSFAQYSGQASRRFSRIGNGDAAGSGVSGAVKLSISVELLGLARLAARRETVELRVSPEGRLSRVVRALGDAVPALVARAQTALPDLP